MIGKLLQMLSPRAVIAILVLVMGVDCHANCRNELQTDVDQLAPAASALGGKRIRATVFLTDKLDVGYRAIADPRMGRIWVAETMCDTAEAQKLWLVAHELGHFVAHALYPRVAEDAYSGHTPRIGVSVHEGLANEFAALILPPSWAHKEE